MIVLSIALAIKDAFLPVVREIICIKHIRVFLESNPEYAKGVLKLVWNKYMLFLLKFT
jgi:hypothetical protein